MSAFEKLSLLSYGMHLDVLIEDRDERVHHAVDSYLQRRCITLTQWKELDFRRQLQNISYEEKIDLIKKGQYLDVFIKDEDGYIRGEVASQGYGLDVLINDDSAHVRAEVAKQGYGLDKLMLDEDKDVQSFVQRYLKAHNLTLEQWKTMCPEKCCN